MSAPLQTTGLGGLICDSNGDVFMSFCNKLNHTTSPTMAEALAHRNAILFCLKLHFVNVTFEGDCLKVISVVKSSKPVGDELHSIIFDIKKRLQQVPGWSLTFSHRKANKAANALTKIVRSLDNDVIWMEEFPSLVASYILDEKFCNQTYEK